MMDVVTYKSRMQRLSLMSLVFFHHGLDRSTRSAYPAPLSPDTAAGPPMSQMKQYTESPRTS